MGPSARVVREKAAQKTDADEFLKVLLEILTETDGNLKYNAPPAALLLPEAQDSEAVVAMQCINALFATNALDEKTIATVIDSLVSG